MACRCPPCADPRMAGNGRLGNLKTCLRISATRPTMVDAPQSPYSTISKSGFAAHHRFKCHFLADWALKKIQVRKTNTKVILKLADARYSGNTLRSPIEAPLISREVLPETYFLLVIMAADAQARPFLQFQASC